MSNLSSELLPFSGALRSRLVFLRNFLRDPRHVGSLVPSQRFLGAVMREMVEEVAPGPLSVAILGIGTGAVGRAFRGQAIYGFDRSPELLSLAQHALPEAELREADVCGPDFSLDALPGDRPIAVVSCIPVVNLSPLERTLFAAQAERLLGDPRVRCFLQYSYLPRTPLKIGGAEHRVRWVLRNLPPAGVHLWRSPDRPSDGLT
jgi:phospholipid N-methyltransferase